MVSSRGDLSVRLPEKPRRRRQSDPHPSCGSSSFSYTVLDNVLLLAVRHGEGSAQRSPRLPAMTAPLDARAAIEALQEHEAWAIIRRSTRAGDRDTVGLVGGRRSVVESLLDVPLEEGVPEAGHIADRLLAVPFRQVPSAASRRTTTAPRWWSSTSRPSASSPSPRSSRRSTTPASSSPTAAASTSTTTPTPSWSRTIIGDEIGQGEGANLVIGRHYRARLADWGPAPALTVFRGCSSASAARTGPSCFFTGDRYLIGASPERHVSIHGGDVRMNPISGTFRLPREAARAPTSRPRCWSSCTTRRRSTSSSWSSTRS